MKTDGEWQTLQTTTTFLFGIVGINGTCQLAYIIHRSDSQPANLTPCLTLAVTS